MRKVGIGIAVAVRLASAALLPSFSGRMTITILGLVLALAVALAALVLWTWLVTPKWLREAAEAYAERLLLSADRRYENLAPVSRLRASCRRFAPSLFTHSCGDAGLEFSHKLDTKEAAPGFREPPLGLLPAVSLVARAGFEPATSGL